jgi:integrase
LDITPSLLSHHISSRLDEGAAKATINRELAALSRAFSLAVENGKLNQKPRIRLLDDSDNVRQGFVSIADYRAIRAQAPEWLSALTDFLYWTGVRLNEGLTLEWRDWDREWNVLRIRSENVKTNQAHEIPLVGQVGEIIRRGFEQRRLDCPFVFHAGGRQITKDRAEVHWRKTTARAGFSGVLIHDLRRSFVRNARQSGLSETVIMQFTGHRTREVFYRYNIIDNDEKRAAIERLDRWATEQPRRSGIVAGQFPKQTKITK